MRYREIVSFSPLILDTIGKVASRFAKVPCFIVPLAIGARRILNTIGKVPPLGAKVTCVLGPLAALPGSGRPGGAGGRPGRPRGPGEAPFPGNAAGRSKTKETVLFPNGAQDPTSRKEA